MTIIKILLVAAATAVLSPTGLAANDELLVKEGYRWVAADGPFACPAKGDVRELVNHAGNDELRLRMVEQLRAYNLVRGTIVKVVQEEPASGLAQIQIAGIIPRLWTLSRFLSTRPIPDVAGKIETPETADAAAPLAPLPGSASPSDAGPAPGATPGTGANSR